VRSLQHRKDSTLDGVGEQVEALMKNYQFPAGYTWKLGDSFEEQDENSLQMLINLLLAIAMIYIVMAAVFESTVYPLSIITSIFMAIVGVIWALFATRTTITIMAMIGVQILIGVVVNIGIVFVAHINELRLGGMERMAAIVQAGRDRLRPSHDDTVRIAGIAATGCGGRRSRWRRRPSYADGTHDHGRPDGRAPMSLFVVPAFYVDRQWRGTRQQFMRRTRRSKRVRGARRQRSRTLSRSQVLLATTLEAAADTPKPSEQMSPLKPRRIPGSVRFRTHRDSSGAAQSSVRGAIPV
jgi:hypothetical protein